MNRARPMAARLKSEYLQNEKRYAKKENAIPPYSKKPG